MAQTAGSVVKQEVASFASTVQSTVQDRAGEQTQAASKAIGDFATAIQHAGDELAGKDQTMAAHLIKGAADRLGELAGALSGKGPDEMLHTLRDFGRRNPAGLAACGVLAGLAIGRIVRSSVEPLDTAGGASTGALPSAALPVPSGGQPSVAGPEQLTLQDASVTDPSSAPAAADGEGR